jgi:hypothetical protein
LDAGENDDLKPHRMAVLRYQRDVWAQALKCFRH